MARRRASKSPIKRPFRQCRIKHASFAASRKFKEKKKNTRKAFKRKKETRKVSYLNGDTTNLNFQITTSNTPNILIDESGSTSTEKNIPTILLEDTQKNQTNETSVQEENSSTVVNHRTLKDMYKTIDVAANDDDDVILVNDYDDSDVVYVEPKKKQKQKRKSNKSRESVIVIDDDSVIEIPSTSISTVNNDKGRWVSPSPIKSVVNNQANKTECAKIITSTPIRNLPNYTCSIPSLLKGFANIQMAPHENLHSKPHLPHNIPQTVSNNTNGNNIQNRLNNQNDFNTFGSNFLNAGTVRTTGLRPIFIDGSNVAIGHSNGKYFSVNGLKICIDYFKMRGHEVTAVVPMFRKRRGQNSNPKLLEQLEKEGTVILTPSRRINGKNIVPYDDRYIVLLAHVHKGIIVSSDNYRDLLLENPNLLDTIENRVLNPTWLKDMIIFPSDPMGRYGPKLDEFLRFPE